MSTGIDTTEAALEFIGDETAIIADIVVAGVSAVSGASLTGLMRPLVVAAAACVADIEYIDDLRDDMVDGAREEVADPADPDIEKLLGQIIENREVLPPSSWTFLSADLSPFLAAISYHLQASFVSGGRPVPMPCSKKYATAFIESS